MGNRRFAQVPTSDDEDDAPPPPPRNSAADETRTQRKRKKVYLPSDDEEGEEIEETRIREQYKKKKKKKKSEESEPETASENEEQEDVEALPVGNPIRYSGKGRGRTSHYQSFDYDGVQYHLEDPVLLVPEKANQKPYVAIIKDIASKKEGSLMVTGQWFYRPEEAEKKAGGNWQSQDTRELFYSFHRDDVPAESVMHKCVVHFIPRDKQIPNRKEHPGFIVQKVYDTDQRKLFKLTDKDYEDIKQHEIDLLVQKTYARLGDIPDIETEDAILDQEDQTKNKRLLRKKNVSPLDVSREDEGAGKSQLLKAETPGSTPAGASEYYTILSNFKVLTGETHRDKWLEKLLQSIQFMCSPADGKQNDEEQKRSINNGVSNHRNELLNKVSFDWPDAAVPAVTALEKVTHDSLSADFQKYNQKMRQYFYNMKHIVLARRLLNKELEPAQILNMLPHELKVPVFAFFKLFFYYFVLQFVFLALRLFGALFPSSGNWKLKNQQLLGGVVTHRHKFCQSASQDGLTAEEKARGEPEETGRMQMTDARCTRCSEKQVGLIDIFQAGHGDRYQLECVACGNTWYASRDDAATLTIEGPNSSKTVGTAPLATAKFEDTQKMLVSPGGDEKGSDDVIKKTTEAFVPVLENQRSFNKTRAEENPATDKAK